MNLNFTSILIGFVAGFLVSFFFGKVLKIVFFLIALGILGFLLYLRIGS